MTFCRRELMNLSDGWAVDHKRVRGGGTVPTILN
jgi:hypothetical protein